MFASEYSTRQRGAGQSVASNQRELARARQLFETRLAQAQTQTPDDTPPIDIPETNDPALQPRPGTPVVQPQALPAAGRWVFLNGEWVQVISGDLIADTGLTEGADPLASAQDAGQCGLSCVVETDPFVLVVCDDHVVIEIDSEVFG